MVNKKYSPAFSYKDIVIISHEKLYRGYFSLEKYSVQFKLFNGAMSPAVEREVFERGNSVAVIPYDPHLDQVILIEQFRVGALAEIAKQQSPWLLEIIAGVVEPGETAPDVAKREAKEGAGLTIAELIPIANYYASPGGTTEYLSLFCTLVNAKDISGVFGLHEEAEDIRVITLPAMEAFSLLNKGKIINATTIIALQWLQINRPTLIKNLKNPVY